MVTYHVTPALLRADGHRLLEVANQLDCLPPVLGARSRPNLGWFRASVTNPAAPAALELSFIRADAAMRLMHDVSGRVRDIGTRCIIAAGAYETIEGWVSGWFERVQAHVMLGVGKVVLPLVVFVAGLAAAGVPRLAIALGALGLMRHSTFGPALTAALEGLVEMSNAALSLLVSDPTFIAFVRTVVDAAPEAFADTLVTAVATPFMGPLAPLAGALAPDVMNLFMDDRQQQEFGAGLLALILGVSRQPAPTLVEVRPDGGARDGTVPASMSESLAAVPSGDQDVLIQELQLADGTTEWQVFINGTQEPELISPDAFDNGGNLLNAAGTTGSTGAVLLAMEQAGIPPGATVQLVGYSQGGAAAIGVAATGTYQVSQMLTVGAPIGSEQVPDEVPWVAVQHHQDLVPALNGSQAGVSADVVTVDVPEGTDLTVMWAGHDRGTYEQTLAQLDTSEVAVLDQLDAFYASMEGAAVVESHVFVAIDG